MDPYFWNRFSVAVHLDDAAKREMTQNPDLKHSYVSPLSSLSHTPFESAYTSQSHLSLASSALVTSPLPTTLRPLSTSHPTAMAPTSKRTRSKLHKTPSTKPLLRPSISEPTEAHIQTPAVLSSPPRSPHLPPQSPVRSFFRSPNFSTFSLSGRPSSRFEFVTTITADAPRRDSWLAKQKKKERHRAWLCWAFWAGILMLVAGIVVAVLVLRAHGIL